MSDKDTPDFTERDKEALIGCIDADHTPDKSNMSVDLIIQFCRDSPAGVFEEKIIGALAVMTEADRSKVKTALKGKVGSQDFDRAVKDYRKRNGMLRMAQSSDSRPKFTDRIENCPLDAHIPNGWSISVQDGVIELVNKGDPPVTFTEKRFPVPIVLSAVLEPLDNQDDTYSYEVAWLSKGRWYKAAKDGAILFDRARIINLADSGAPVDSENNKGLVRWLAAQRDTREIPSKQVVTRCGWHGWNRFVWGQQIAEVHRNDETLVPVDSQTDKSKCQYEKNGKQNSESKQCTQGNECASGDSSGMELNSINGFTEYTVDWSHKVKGGERDTVEGLRVHGSVEKQKEFLLKVCKRFPVAAFLVGAGCAAPLLRPLREHGRLDVNGFTVEVVSDQAGVGKTTGNELAASIWGQPSRLVRSCNRTVNVGWEAWRHVCCDLPIFAEEAQSLKPEDRERIIYEQSQGIGRERGNRDGTLRATKQFFNVLLVASEESLKGQDTREGVSARLISMPPMFGSKNAEYAAEAKRIKKECNTNYGHVGQTYLRYLLNETKGSQWKTVLQKFDEIESALEEKIADDVNEELRSIAIRMVSRVAACGVGLWALMESLGVSAEENSIILDKTILVAEHLALLGMDAEPLWKRALGVVQSWAAQNKNRIAGMEPFSNGMYSSKRIPDVYIGKVVTVREAGKCICFYLTAFDKAIIEYLKKDPKEIRKAFLREKISVPNKDGEATRYEKSRGERGVFIPIEMVFPDGNDCGTVGDV
jgi:hypothetical protein